MKTFMVKDLSTTEELDRSAMGAVRGGVAIGEPYSPFPLPITFEFPRIPLGWPLPRYPMPETTQT